ncbi:MAG: hypothetical protein JXB50_03045, partial [Spirochaetes bacterium]|nr:hypothetical protein [Spirochaetota bacterium]
SYFLMGTIIFFAGIFLIYKKEISLMTFINSLLIFIISLSLLSFIWLGMLEGTSWIKSGRSFKFYDLVAYPHFNMFPGYIMNIFMQDFHGLVSSTHAWGNAVKYDNNILLSGGFFSSLLIFITFYLYYRKSDNKIIDSTAYRKKIYFWILFIIMITTLLVMMGKFTPFYFLFCLLIPWVFKFPFAFYFLFYQGFTFSILTGYGMDFLTKDEIRLEFNRHKIIFIYISMVVLFVIISLFEPVYTYKEGFKTSYMTLFELKELKWFLINKILILLLFITIALVIFFNLKKSFHFITILAAIIVIESFVYGYFSLYKNTMSPRLSENNKLYRRIFQSHYKRPLDNPLFKDIEELKNFLKDKNQRYAGIISTIDNLAWFTDKKSTFGYDSKPVLPEMYYLINSMSDNYPYELFILKYPINVFRNLNIGYLLTYQYHSRNLYINYYDTEYSMNYEPNYKPGENWIEIFPIELTKNKNPDGVNLIAYKLLDTIPYYYFQDRFVLINGKAGFNIIKDNDFREKLYMSSDDFNKYVKNIIRPDFDEDKKDKNKKSKIPEFITHFNNLQNENKVVRIIEEKANRVILEVEIKKPSVMIRNESFHNGWSVFIKDISKADKKNKKIKSKLLHVNYIQQGFPINPGRYIVEYKFFPEVIKKGLTISLFIFLLLIIYSLYLLYIKKQKF